MFTKLPFKKEVYGDMEGEKGWEGEYWRQVEGCCRGEKKDGKWEMEREGVDCKGQEGKGRRGGVNGELCTKDSENKGGMG